MPEKLFLPANADLLLGFKNQARFFKTYKSHLLVFSFKLDKKIQSCKFLRKDIEESKC